MVDTISASFPVANVAIPSFPSSGNSVRSGSSTPPPTPVPARTDSVNLSPEAQIAAREVFSERPDINTSQEESVQISDASEAVLESAESFVTAKPAPETQETVTVPPPDLNSISSSVGNSIGNSSGNSAEVSTGDVETDSTIQELVGIS